MQGILTQQDEYYTAIGRALTSWGYVETTLGRLFCCCVGPPSGFPTRQAFWAVVSFEGKLRMVEAVMTASFSDASDIGKRWLSIGNRLRRKNRIRNKIAHGSVVPFVLQPPLGHGIDVFFAPYFWGTLGESPSGPSDPRPKDRMYVPDIHRATETFNALAEELNGIATDVFEVVQRPIIQRQASASD